MRKYKKHGSTNVCNQIILEDGVYSQFFDSDRNICLKVSSLTKGKRIATLLKSNIKLKGMLRLIVKDNIVLRLNQLKRSSKVLY